MLSNPNPRRSHAWYRQAVRERGEKYQTSSGVHQPHDKGYKYLLSHKGNFLELQKEEIRRIIDQINPKRRIR